MISNLSVSDRLTDGPDKEIHRGAPLLNQTLHKITTFGNCYWGGWGLTSILADTSADYAIWTCS